MIGGVLTAIISFFLLLNINSTLTFLALIPLVVFGLVSSKAFSAIRPVFRERGAITAEVNGRLTETVGGIRVVKGFHAEDRDSYDAVTKAQLADVELVLRGSKALYGDGDVIDEVRERLDDDLDSPGAVAAVDRAGFYCTDLGADRDHGIAETI